MTNSTPKYILFLFAAISVILLFIIINWVWEKTMGGGNNNTEGFENPQYTYLPSKKTPNLSIEFGLSDLAIDISNVCEFIKVDNQLKGTERAIKNVSESTPKPTEEPAEDYTVPYTELQIYKMYNSATGFSTTSNESIYKMMDQTYGDLFDSTKIGKMSDQKIADMWNSNKSIRQDNHIYNLLNYFVIQSKLANRQCSSTNKSAIGLSSYYLQQIQKNKESSSILLSLKKSFYSIIKPRFLVNTLSNLYWNNAKQITNSDKGTYNSTIFVLNTYAGLANKNTLSADLAEEKVAKIISEDTTFTMDALWLYQLGSIAIELIRFIERFQRDGGVTSGDGKPAINTTPEKIVSGYPIYLKKVSQVESQSPILFFMENLPDNSDCSVVNDLVLSFM